MKIPATLLCERNAEGFAVELATCGRLANNGTKSSDKQNLYLSRKFHGSLLREYPVRKPLAVIVIYAAIGVTTGRSPKYTSSGVRYSRGLMRTDGGEQACGCVPVNGLTLAARAHGLHASLDLRNSGDTAGDKLRVVGYGAFGFFEA
jgi:hypothetical protein